MRRKPSTDERGAEKIQVQNILYLVAVSVLVLLSYLKDLRRYKGHVLLLQLLGERALTFTLTL